MDVAERIRKWKFYISLLTRKEMNSFNSFAYLLFIIRKVGLRICQWILRIGNKLSSDNIALMKKSIEWFMFRKRILVLREKRHYHVTYIHHIPIRMCRNFSWSIYSITKWNWPWRRVWFVLVLKKSNDVVVKKPINSNPFVVFSFIKNVTRWMLFIEFI